MIKTYVIVDALTQFLQIFVGSDWLRAARTFKIPNRKLNKGEVYGLTSLVSTLSIMTKPFTQRL